MMNKNSRKNRRDPAYSGRRTQEKPVKTAAGPVPEESAVSGDQLHQERRRQRRELQRERRARAVRRQKILIGIAAAFLILVIAVGGQLVHKAWATSTPSEEVLAYRDTVEKYAEQEGVED